jgi:hypothetical protein
MTFGKQVMQKESLPHCPWIAIEKKSRVAVRLSETLGDHVVYQVVFHKNAGFHLL